MKDKLDLLIENEEYWQLNDRYYNGEFNYKEFKEKTQPILDKLGIEQSPLKTSDERLKKLEDAFLDPDMNIDKETYIKFKQRILKDKEAGL